MSRRKSGAASSRSTQLADADIIKLFTQFQEAGLNNNDEPFIGVDGLEKLCGEMGIDSQSRVLILLQKECGSSTMGEITQYEFVAGMKKLGLDSDPYAMKKIGTKLKNIDRSLDYSSGSSSTAPSKNSKCAPATSSFPQSSLPPPSPSSPSSY